MKSCPDINTCLHRLWAPNKDNCRCLENSGRADEM